MIDELRQTLRRLQKPAGMENAGCLALGVPTVDAALGGGLMRGALHEIAAAGEAHVATAAGFALAVANLSWPGLSRPSRLGRHCVPDRDARPKAGHDRQNIVWIAEDMALAESGAPYGPGLEACGLPPEHLLTVAAARACDLLWAMEEALRCRAVAAVIGEVRHGAVDRVAVRRLSLAAATSGALALLLRSSPPQDASTAATRWVVGAAPSVSVIPGREPTGPRNARPDGERTRNPETNSEIVSGFRVRPFGPSRNDEEKIGSERNCCFAAQLTRNRRGPLGSWILQWSDDDGRFLLATHAQPVAAPAADRPHRQIA